MSSTNPFALVGPKTVSVRTVDSLVPSRFKTRPMRAIDSSESHVDVGSAFEYYQCSNWPSVKNASSESQPIISITRPPCIFVANTVLQAQRSRLDGDGKYQLSIIQELLSNEEKRWYGETKTGKDFYLTPVANDGCRFPLLDRVTYPPSNIAPRGNPSYSKNSTIDIDLSADRVYGTIFAFNEPLMSVRTSLLYKDYEHLVKNRPPSGKFLLTFVEKLTKWRTWLVIREVRGATDFIYPLIALDWAFEFQMKVTSEDADGIDVTWQFVDTPISQAMPVVSFDKVANYRQLPEFPNEILTQTKSSGEFCIANDAFGWKAVLGGK